MCDSVAGLCGAGGAKFDGLPPHGMLLGATLLQRNDPAEHDVHASQNLKATLLACACCYLCATNYLNHPVPPKA